MDRGWLKLHRQLMDNMMLAHDNNAFLVFMKLLMLVNRQGEYANGRFGLGEIMNLNPRTLYGVLVRLENAKMIKMESKSKYTIITVVNWGQYQGVNTPRNTKVTDEKQLSLNTSLNNTATTRQQHGNTYTRIRSKNKNKAPSKIDVQLAAKEQAARSRSPGAGYQKALSIAAALKEKRRAMT